MAKVPRWVRRKKGNMGMSKHRKCGKAHKPPGVLAHAQRVLEGLRVERKAPEMFDSFKDLFGR